MRLGSAEHIAGKMKVSNSDCQVYLSQLWYFRTWSRWTCSWNLIRRLQWWRIRALFLTALLVVIKSAKLSYLCSGANKSIHTGTNTQLNVWKTPTRPRDNHNNHMLFESGKIIKATAFKNREIPITYFGLNFPKSGAVTTAPIVKPRYTKEPRIPIFALVSDRSFFSSVRAAGMIPWSKLITIFVIKICAKMRSSLDGL